MEIYDGTYQLGIFIEKLIRQLSISVFFITNALLIRNILLGVRPEVCFYIILDTEG